LAGERDTLTRQLSLVVGKQTELDRQLQAQFEEIVGIVLKRKENISKIIKDRVDQIQIHFKK
jgi:hypothetical protein